MKLIVAIYLLMLMNLPSIEEVRKRFKSAVNKKEDAQWMLENLGNATIENQPLLAGYYGASKVLMANFTLWPATKLSLVKSGMELLNKSIDHQPLNSELRLIRFNMENNIPQFLGYKEHIVSDFVYLKSYVIKLNTNNCSEFLNDIVRSIKESKYLKEEDKIEFLNNINTHSPC